jgi:hypothetical protein
MDFGLISITSLLTSRHQFGTNRIVWLGLISRLLNILGHSTCNNANICICFDGSDDFAKNAKFFVIISRADA